MTTYTLPLATTLEAFSSLAPFRAAKKNRDMAPILGAVQITPGTIIATDRYAAARYQHETITGDDEPLLVPAEAVDWIASLKRTTMRDAKIAVPTTRDGEGGYAADNYRVTIISETNGRTGTEEITVTLLSETRDTIERSQSFDPCPGKNFPPIERLFPHDIDSAAAHAAPLAGNGFALATFQLERLAKVAKTYGPADATSIRTRLFANEPLSEHQRTVPTYWRVHCEGAATPLDGIAQPLTHP